MQISFFVAVFDFIKMCLTAYQNEGNFVLWLPASDRECKMRQFFEDIRKSGPYF